MSRLLDRLVRGFVPRTKGPVDRRHKQDGARRREAWFVRFFSVAHVTAAERLVEKLRLETRARLDAAIMVRKNGAAQSNSG